MTGRELAEALKCGKPACACRNGKVVHCPVTTAHKHGDASPSMSVTESGGKALFRCHAGCSQDDVIAALTDRRLWGEAAQSAPTPIRTARGSLVRTYEYRDTTGTLVAEHGRFENASGKTFAWRVPGKDWRDGLGAMPISDLPLYNLASVLEMAGSVWFCEGEKATDACTQAGLLAVCLGGGASQQAFGNALDVLRDRDVILWPDNDEQGYAFMGRIAALLPQARYVRPLVPPKGDAYDYFQAGGTVDALTALLDDTAPIISVEGVDAVTVVLKTAAGRIRFEFTEIAAQRREVNAEMRVAVEIPTKRPTPYSTRINLSSSSGREGIRRELESIFGKELGWTQLLSEACDSAKETWRGVDYSVDLVDVEMPGERQWTVERTVPEGVTTIPFGMGGSCKSYIVGDIALHCLYGMPWMRRATKQVESILVIDYEDRADEWKRRIADLCDGHGWPFPNTGYRYMPGRAIPLADQMVQLKRAIEEWHIGLVIVDSAVSAVGASLIDEQAAARLVNALTDLGVTSILIAHNTKAEDSDYPFGSIFWHNLVRATHFIEARQEEGSNVVDVVIWNRKGNRGKQKPIPLRVTFSPDGRDGPVSIDLTASIPASFSSAAQGSNAWRILQVMKDAGKPMRVGEIVSVSGISEKIVSSELSRKARWFVRLDKGLWGVKADHDEVPA